jgi:hypothetical protein
VNAPGHVPGTGPLDGVLTRLAALDWDDVAAVAGVAERLLREVVTSGDLVAAVDHVRHDPARRDACEHDDFFRKLVLARDPGTGVALRLHQLGPEDETVPHDHRASFAALQLAGRYRHLLYDPPAVGSGREVAPEPTPAQIAALRPTTARVERPGTFYALHHGAVHATLVGAGHLSLVARGPSRRRRLMMLHPATGRIEWLYGGADETPAALQAKRMPDEVFDDMARFATRVVGDPCADADADPEDLEVDR